MVVVRAFVVNQKEAGFGIERESLFSLHQVLAFELLRRHRQAFGKRCNILRIQSRPMVLQQFAHFVQSIWGATSWFSRCTIVSILLGEILPLLRKDLNCQFSCSFCFESFSILARSVTSMASFSRLLLI